MNYRFFKYIVPIFAVITSKAKADVKNADGSVLYQRVFGPSSYSERQTRVGYICSSNLILFPFHVFW